MAWAGARWDNRSKPCNKLPGDVGGLMSALSNLSQSLTINGVTKTPTFLYEGKNATTSAWTATVGENATIAGGGADITDEDTPLIKSTDRAAGSIIGGKYYSASTQSFAQIGSDDFVFECVARCDDFSSRRYIATTRVTDGWEMRSDNYFQLMVYTTSGLAIVSTISGAVGVGQWAHLMFFGDYSGKITVYVNGIHSQTSVADTNIGGPYLNTKAMDLLSGFPGNVAYLAMWQGAGWLDTHLQPTIALARAKALFGANTDETRDSLAYLHKPVSGAKKYFLVGKNWMRLAQDLTGKPYYQKEAAATNIQDHDSFDLSSATGGWTEAGVTTTVDATDTPIVGATGTKIIEDGSTGAHGIYNTTNSVTMLLGANSYYVFVKPVGRTECYLRLYNGSANNVSGYFDLTGDGAVGTVAYGANWSTAAGAIEAVGDGWYRCEINGTYIPASGNVRCYLYASSGSETVSYTGNSAEALQVIGSQAATAASSSPVYTPDGANTTRLADA